MQKIKVTEHKSLWDSIQHNPEVLCTSISLPSGLRAALGKILLPRTGAMILATSVKCLREKNPQ